MGRALLANVGLCEVRIFSILENGENGLGDEGADGGNAPLPEFLG